MFRPAALPIHHPDDTPMIRRPRLLNKKRGSRRSGWQIWGTVGETLFFAALFLLGSFGFGLIIAIVTFATDQAPVTPGFGFWTLLIASISLIFLGTSGVTYRILGVGASHERRSALAKRAAEIELVPRGKLGKNDLPNVPQLKRITESPGTQLAFRLPTIASPIWNLAASAALAFMWTGCALSLLGVSIVSIVEGQPRVLLTILIVPISAAGIWTFRRFIIQLKKSAGIGLSIVEISNHPLQPGQTCEVYVAQYGRAALKSFQAKLVCEELSTFRQGTDVRTEKHAVFEEIVLAISGITIDPNQPWERKFTLAVPPSAMHSFQSPHNSISWWIVIHGEGSPWPSYFRRFPVVVLPHGATTATNL
ncbi:hypothetical protein [Rosistilla oblonga]|uniref:hypothetical protein n=1 Tax=Rosistilla oblonga TaxID=2527990 RepID=UPI003A97F7CB